MLTRQEMEDALIKLDRRLAHVERILQPMASDVLVLKAAASNVKTDLRTLSAEVSGLQRDFASFTARSLPGSTTSTSASNQLDARFAQVVLRLEARGVI